jgi:hypothetical protein
MPGGMESRTGGARGRVVSWLSPPEQLTEKLRWFFALLAVTNLAIVLPLLTTASAPDPTVQVLGVAALACLGRCGSSVTAASASA